MNREIIELDVNSFGIQYPDNKPIEVTYKKDEMNIFFTIELDGTKPSKVTLVELQPKTSREWKTLAEILRSLSLENPPIIFMNDIINITNFETLSVGTLIRFVQDNDRGPNDQNDVKAWEQRSKTARNSLTKTHNGFGQLNPLEKTGVKHGGSKKYKRKSRKVYKSRRSRVYRSKSYRK